GELEPARAQLERAWQLGLRDPDAELALGLTYGRLYERGLDGLEQLPVDEARAARRAELERTVRAAAVHALADARGASTVPAEHVDALIALVEDRYDDADRSARAALIAAPWLYQAYHLIGEGHLVRAWNAMVATDHATAAAELSQAGDALARAIDIARSDPE